MACHVEEPIAVDAGLVALMYVSKREVETYIGSRAAALLKRMVVAVNGAPYIVADCDGSGERGALGIRASPARCFATLG